MYTERYKYRNNKQNKSIKQVLISWCKIIAVGLTIYATLYILLVAAGCPY